MEIRRDYYPEDIAQALITIAGADMFEDFDEAEEVNQKKADCEDAIYDFMATCENPYNRDSFRVVWDLLQDITDRFERGMIQ